MRPYFFRRCACHNTKNRQDVKNLLNFLMRYSPWVVFAFYASVSCYLLYSDSPAQRHVYLTSAGAVASTVYDGVHNVTSYFHLREINEGLHARNSELEDQILSLRRQLQETREAIHADTMTVTAALHPFSFIIASVTNNSIAHPYNYITINKGALDGVVPEMGVVDQNGVVGVVNITSDHHARINSLLNPDFRLSCKVKGSDAFGSLVWDGHTPEEAVLEELPKHTVFAPGDTIVTSGYSAVFPEGIPVGSVIASSSDSDDNFFRLRIKLFTDFTTLSTVRLIKNNELDDIRRAEQ